jgi:hypothetical protein
MWLACPRTSWDQWQEQLWHVRVETRDGNPGAQTGRSPLFGASLRTPKYDKLPKPYTPNLRL